ncbi:MAG: HlyD family efflux transporter periplasmic adaptor subunit [Lysobacter sp.]|nr:HlyD family efflux transporter periplasmic adaptor subunit [Lysobacter sp.]
MLSSGAVVLVVAMVGVLGRADQLASRDRVMLAKVQQGEFVVEVRGVGELTSKHTQFLGAKVEGQVERIAVEAGAAVKKGDILAILANPKLHEQLSESQWELAAQRKEQQANLASLQAELVNMQTDAQIAQSELKVLSLREDSEGKLQADGIVSKLTYEQTRRGVEQQKQRIVAAQERVRMMQQRLSAQREADAARLNKMGNTLDILRQQVADLTVRAPIDGVVGQMALKLGQQVVGGAEIGRITPYDNLVALLDVQDYQARDVRVNQSVRIDTRGAVLPGRVTRIDPGVTNGMVKVEVTLDGPVPASLRANQSVEGVIEIARKPNALFVSRPPQAQGHGQAAVYRVEGDTAMRTLVDFGLVSTRDIEVLGTLKAGDQIVVSDVSAWGEHERVLLK